MEHDDFGRCPFFDAGMERKVQRKRRIVMKNVRKHFHSKQGKVVAWLIIALVLMLAIALLVLMKWKPKDTVNPIEPSDNSTEMEMLEEEEPPIEYDGVLSGDSYQIKNGSILFANGSEIMSFCISTNPDGPTKDDVWYGNYGRDSAEIDEDFDDSIQKVYVYYLATDSNGVIIDTGYLRQEAGSTTTILGKTVNRSTITEINILNSLASDPNDSTSWDVSAAQDGSVKAWITNNVLYIAGNGGVKVSKANYLFYY